MKVAKTYAYIGDLLMDVLNKRELSDQRLDAPTEVDPKDPKHIRRCIGKGHHPTKTELIERHKSRFSK